MAASNRLRLLCPNLMWRFVHHGSFVVPALRYQSSSLEFTHLLRSHNVIMSSLQEPYEPALGLGLASSQSIAFQTVGKMLGEPPCADTASPPLPNDNIVQNL